MAHKTNTHELEGRPRTPKSLNGCDLVERARVASYDTSANRSLDPKSFSSDPKLVENGIH